MFTSLLNNHINKLIGVNHKIINTTECSAHELSNVKQYDKNCIQIIAKWIGLATKSDSFTP